MEVVFCRWDWEVGMGAAGSLTLPGWVLRPGRPGAPSRALTTLPSLLEGGGGWMVVSRLCLLLLLCGKDG